MIFYAKILILEELNLLSMEWWCIFIILEDIFIIHKNITPSFINVWFFRKISISRFHHYKKHLSVARIKNKIHFSNALACLLWQCITIFCQMKSSYLTCLVPFFFEITHILINCTGLYYTRRQFYIANSMHYLFENVPLTQILDFLKYIEIYKEI